MKFFTSLLVINFLSVSVLAENWPQWRGPAGTGATSEKDLPTTWDPETNIAWRVELSEAGNSSPVVWGDRVLLTQPIADTNERTLICLSLKDGKQLWQKGVQYATEETTHRTNHYCSPSPVTDGERVIVWFGSAGLICYDLDGKEQWRRDLGPLEHMWGYGTSPILHEDVCILNFGPGDREALLAVDKTTGKDVWKVEPLSLEAESELSGPENNGNAKSKEGDPRSKMLRGTWGTPVIVNTGERMELVVNHPRRVAAYDPNTGTLLWTCGGSGPLAYTSPVVASNSVVALGGYAGASLAVEVGGHGNVTDSRRVWHKNRDGSWLGTGVAIDDHIYVGNMNGIVHCLNAKTGEQVWKQRLSASKGRATTWGSMTLTGDGLLYLILQNGDTFVIRPSIAGFEQIARNSLGESTNSTVVVSNAKILIRTFDNLWCIGK